MEDAIIEVLRKTEQTICEMSDEARADYFACIKRFERQICAVAALMVIARYKLPVERFPYKSLCDVATGFGFSKGKRAFLVSILEQANLTAAERIAYLIIVHRSEATGNCVLAQKALARTVGCSISTLIRAVRKLEDLGLLKSERAADGYCLRYYPILPSSNEEEKPDNQD